MRNVNETLTHRQVISMSENQKSKNDLLFT